jgi:uncharacterized Fe-S center protein
MKSDVYFIKVSAADLESRLTALRQLLQKTSPFLAYQKGEFIPLKITIGDSACTYNLSPKLIKAVVWEVKEKGAKPFLFDTNVIYQGQRQNAIDYLNLAQSKGFGHSQVGAPFIIADGLFGQDGRIFNLQEKVIEKIKLPSFIGFLDSLLVLSHPTGHIVSGYAGALKNIAMGMSCRPTKQVQHSSLKPTVIEQKCVGCGCCLKICPVSAITLKNNLAQIDAQLCLGCGECLCACKFEAISINWEEDPAVFCQRMVEVANFILEKFKNKFFFNFAFDITQECDCMSDKDEKMIAENLGILASQDAVSIDKATLDLACKTKTSDFLEERKAVYAEMLEYAAAKGIGNLDYNLIQLSTK